MKKIQNHILKEIIPLFIMANFFFMFLLMLQKIITLADLFFTKNVPLPLILETLVYLMPSVLTLTIPISSLLSVLIAFSRLSADSELIAMRAIGAGNYDLMKPVIAFGAGAALLGLSMSLFLGATGSYMALNNLNKIIESISIKDLHENEMYSELPGFLLFVKKKLDETNFEGVVVIKTDDNTIISAEQANIRPTDQRSMEMIFKGGRITLINSKGVATAVGFKKMTVNIPLTIDIAKAIDSPLTMELDELIKTKDSNPKIAFELSKRFSLPISAILMSLFGFSLGVFLSRSGKTYGVIISVAVAFGFNFLMIYFENSSVRLSIPPMVGAWIPDFVLLAFLIFFLKRAFR